MRKLRSVLVAACAVAAVLAGPAATAGAAPAGAAATVDAQRASVDVRALTVVPLARSGVHVFGTRAECEELRRARQSLGNPTSQCTYWTFAGAVYYWTLWVY